MSIALAIPTAAAWVPERAETLKRLRTSLFGTGYETPPEGTKFTHGVVREFRERTHFSVWATSMWTWLEETGADWGLSLQDDVLVAPNFWKALEAMLAAVPPEVEIICLESAHPATPLLHSAGEVWYSTAEMLIGVAYVARRETYAAFREWRETRLKPGAWFPGPQCVTEDNLFGQFAMNTGRRVYSPVRTLVDHDVALKSVHGNDDHPNRRPRVRWDNAGLPLETYELPAYWKVDNPPHLGRGYGDGSIAVAKRWIEGLTDEDVRRMTEDDGKAALRRVLGTMLISGKPVDLCCLCGRHATAVVGMTGLQVCPGCVGVCAKEILTNMVVQ